MRTFIDVISGDEVLSDKYPIKEVDDIAYEVDCKFIEFQKPSDDDIEYDTSEGAPDKTSSEIDVVHEFALHQTNFDQKSYYEHLKRYAAAIEKHLSTTNRDRVPAFKKAFKDYVTKMMHQWGSLQCYVGPSLDPNGMVAILN
ncbi:translationally controlled tumor protein [Aspergillus flavus]|uniref:Translationally-controlled tumor protein homolog n=1 Tax=Aspergillus flavus TaxID=5059 RepID=A0AB74CPA8_ASPFL|nr:translationally controlled tumor protein [Aspergillus flavus]RMZ46936.1 translationally controlled tumor protein [Aspergillus flavus]